MSNIRRTMMAAGRRGGSAVDWETIAKGMLDASVAFELPASVDVNPSMYAFYDRRLMTGHATIANGVTSVANGAFRNCYALEGVTIPNTVTSLENYSFQGCEALTEVTIPNTVTSIGAQAFSGCSGLTSINIPSGVTIINSSAFQGTKSLESLDIPNSVTSFGAAAFYACGLKSVTIHNTVTSIGAQAFRGSEKLTEVVMESSTPPTLANSNAFQDCNALTAIYVPDASVATYKAASNWSSYASIIKGISERPT